MTALLTVAASPGDRAQQSLPAALELVDAVRNWDRTSVAAVLSDADLPAMCVALAALVDDGRPLSELLAWVDDLDLVDGWTWDSVLAAHCAWEQHRGRGLPIPPHVRQGQRIYDRARARHRRSALRRQKEAS